jgi:hypothetical protein
MYFHPVRVNIRSSLRMDGPEWCTELFRIQTSHYLREDREVFLISSNHNRLKFRDSHLTTGGWVLLRHEYIMV